MNIHDAGLKERILSLYPQLVEIRRSIHSHPELGEHEYHTMDLICGMLKKWGIEYTANVAGTGVVGIIRGHMPGPVAGLRADMDALPLMEDNDLPYRSRFPGVMHACGHDIHTTILLGAAKLLSERRSELQGSVKLFFQPAEETIGGAERMIRAGCMKNPKVDYMLGLHVTTECPTGYIRLKYGQLTSNQDKVNLTIKGKTGHGAMPESAVDAILIAGHIITALQSLVSRNVSPLRPVVFSMGIINGGTSNSIIADSVRIQATLRTPDEEIRRTMHRRITELCTGVAQSFGGDCEVTIINGYKAQQNDEDMVNLVRRNAVRLLGRDHVIIADDPSMAAEDFSFFSELAKGVYYHIGCSDPEKGAGGSVHNVNFIADEECMKVGVALQVENVMSLLKDASLPAAIS